MPRYVTAEVSASAMPGDVVSAIVDSAIENKKREKESWLSKYFSWSKVGVRGAKPSMRDVFILWQWLFHIFQHPLPKDPVRAQQ